MAAGQSALAVAADVAALDALAEQLSVLELSRGAAHVVQLRVLLQLEAVGRSAGMDLATVAHAALALGCSEHRAGRLLAQAHGLGQLPGALEALECGLLTVEQADTVVEQLTPLPFPVRLLVWQRLQHRLSGCDGALPPARLAELLRRWVIAADPADAVQRRQQARAGRRLDYRRRVDGLNDLFALGLDGPDTQAILSRVRDRAHPVGPDDDRTADQRRLDAFTDLLLGRDPLPLHDPHDPLDPLDLLDPPPATTCRGPAGGGRAACGCWPGAPVPCGAELLVHVSLPTALGLSHEPAELVGHGPLEPDLLAALLLARPRLRPVWVDEQGVPVAVGARAHAVPVRDDPAAVRQALLDLTAQPPPERLHPRHPDDHPPPPDGTACQDAPPQPATDRAHPAGTPGSYRLPRDLQRLIDVRSPRCEWPGCGARAVRCDAEHDLAWPAGATCACNLGPCCRRHHRIKQQGWTKTRSSNGVTWTSPGRGRSWLSPSQHQTPAAPAAPAGSPAAAATAAVRGQTEGRARRRDAVLDQNAPVAEPGDHLREHLLAGDSRWTLDLDDPYAWSGA